jgi:hypothetical protein
MADASRKHELAHRVTNGVHVSLFWIPDEEALTLEVFDEHIEELFELELAHDCGLDAFRHPYAYLVQARMVALGRRIPA